MPIYGYKCNKCEEEFDVLCGYTEYEQRCPECESMDTKRQLSAPSGKVTKGVYEEML